MILTYGFLIHRYSSSFPVLPVALEGLERSAFPFVTTSACRRSLFSLLSQTQKKGSQAATASLPQSDKGLYPMTDNFPKTTTLFIFYQLSFIRCPDLFLCTRTLFEAWSFLILSNKSGATRG